MKDVFLRLVTLSLTCSVVLLPLLLFGKKLRGRYAAKTLYFLWLLLALRMVLPLPSVLPQAPVTVSLPSYTVEIPARPPTAPAAPAAPAVPMAPDAAWKPEGTVTTPQSVPTQSAELTEIAAAVWLAGIAVFLVWQIVGYLLARRRFSRGARWEPEYREGVTVYRSLRVCTRWQWGCFGLLFFCLPRAWMGRVRPWPSPTSYATSGGVTYGTRPSFCW